MKNTIKIWPFIDNISNAIISYQTSTINFDSIIYLDFSNVRSINSSGAAMTIVKLLPLLNKFKNSIWEIIKPEDAFVNSFLDQTGVYRFFTGKILNKSLFSITSTNEEASSISQHDQLDIYTTSFPLLKLEYAKYERRVCVDDFIDKVMNLLIPFSTKYDLRLHVLLKVIKEIAKNSEDHTSADAIFGVDVVENLHSGHGKVLFSFCDFGIGIHGTIKKYLIHDKSFRNDASSKFSISDSYQYAYTPGFTTLMNKHNKGIGMSMILDGVNLLDLELTIYDAKSMGFIPVINTHEEIRRNFWNTGNSVGFYYYGIMNLKRK
jgi:hypothetical protein